MGIANLYQNTPFTYKIRQKNGKPLHLNELNLNSRNIEINPFWGALLPGWNHTKLCYKSIYLFQWALLACSYVKHVSNMSQYNKLSDCHMQDFKYWL